MPRSFKPYQKKYSSPLFYKLYQPVKKVFPEISMLKSRGDRPLQMTFEDQLIPSCVLTINMISFNK